MKIDQSISRPGFPPAALLLFMLALMGTVPASAQTDAPLIPRSVLLGESERRSIQLSPDGRTVGYIAPHNGRMAFWLLDADGTTPARPLPGGGATGPWAWTYDNRMMVVIPNPVGDRLVMRTREGDSLDITPVHGSMLQIMAMNPATPGAAIVASHTDSAAAAGIYRVDLRSGQSARIRQHGGYDQWHFDASLRPRAARRPTPGGYELIRFDDQGEPHPIGNYGFEEYQVSGVISVAAGGKSVFVIDNIGLDKSALKEVDIATGREKILMQDPLSDLVPAGATIDPITGRPRAVVGYQVRMRRHLLDSAFAPDFAALGALHGGDVSHAGSSVDGWLIRYLDGGPIDYYVYDRRTRKGHHLFNEMPALESYTLAKRHVILPLCRDGRTLACDLYLPPGSDTDNDGRPDSPLPTVVYVHGGPWIGFEWNIWLANRNFQLLANRGYAVIRAEFRGSSGLGRAFMNAGTGEFGGKMLEDIVDIAGWASREDIAQPDRTAIWGWSYGGFAAFGTLAFHPDVFACGIAMYGVSDLDLFMRGKVAQFGEGAMSEWLTRIGDFRTKQGTDLLARQSPVHAVERVQAPLLVAHGSRDQVVPRVQSDTMVHALRAHDKPVTYFIFPEEPHDFRNPTSWEAFWAIAERFLHDNLGGRYEPFGEEMKRANMQMVAGTELIPGLAAARPRAN